MLIGVRCRHQDPDSSEQCNRLDTELVFGGILRKDTPLGLGGKIESLQITFLCPRHR